MSCKPRLLLSDTVYQVRSDSARNEKIFKDENMRTFFLKCFYKLLKKHLFSCYAFSIAENHYHMAIRTGNITVSKFFRKLNSAFARYYNKKKGTHGAVVSRPFTSTLFEDGEELKQLIRYIHLNPVRSGLCSIAQLDSYTGCGHGGVIKRLEQSCLDTDFILNLFNEADKLRAYEEFVNNGFNNHDPVIIQIRESNSGKQKYCNPWNQIVGSEEFKRRVIEQDASQRVKVPRYDIENVSLERIHTTIEMMLEMQEGELMRQGRTNIRSTARELFAYVARFRFDFSGVKIAEYLKKSDSAVSRMLSRFENLNGKDYLVEMVSRLMEEEIRVAA
ncbi:MAG: hypothetical protein GX640_03135 [Fibrobacter sp.]|nr:hypothetical protein [Fibrobacter sp.]